MSMRVTAITHKAKPVFVSIISQVTPSEILGAEASRAYEPMFLEHLKSVLGIRGIKRVVMHEPLSNLRKIIFLHPARGVPRTEVGAGCKARRPCRRNAASW